MAKGYVLSGEDRRRLRELVKDHAQAPARRPVVDPNSPVLGPARVVPVEIVSGPDGNGDYVVKLVERLPDGTWQERSPVTVTMEDMNA